MRIPPRNFLLPLRHHGLSLARLPLQPRTRSLLSALYSSTPPDHNGIEDKTKRLKIVTDEPNHARLFLVDESTEPPQNRDDVADTEYSEGSADEYVTGDSQDVQLGRMHRVLRSFHLRLRKNRPEEATEYLQQRLAEGAFSDHYVRFRVYEKAIHTLLDRASLGPAISLFNSMLGDTVTPSSLLRAKMASLIYLRDATAPHRAPEGLVDALIHILALSSFTQQRLVDLLDYLNKVLDVQVEVLNGVVHCWRESRPTTRLTTATINKLISLAVRLDSLDVAEQWLDVHESDLTSGSQRQDHTKTVYHAVAPYTTMISELDELGALTPEILDSTLQRMDERQVEPDLPLFNTLISTYVRAQDMHKVWAIYDFLILKRSAELMPDSFTYGTLFNSLYTHTPSNRRRARLRGVRQSENARDPRQLFREMMQSHTLATFGRPATRSPVLNTAALNVALRTLVHTCDYLAAAVCLQTFEDCKIQVDTKTFRVVLVDLLGRVRSGLRVVAESDRWVDRFLPGLDLFDPNDIRIELVGTLLEIAVHQMSQNDRGASSTSQTHCLPSVAAILTGGGPSKQAYDIRPLGFLLHRAAYANMDHGKGVSRGIVNKALKELKTDLLPKLSVQEQLMLSRFRSQLMAQKKAARAKSSGKGLANNGDLSEAEATNKEPGSRRGEVELQEKMADDEDDRLVPGGSGC